jgi:hypothetical protein
MAKKPEVSRVSSPAAKIPEKRVTAPARADEPASSAIKAVKALAAPVATPPTQASDAPLPPLAAPADDGGLKSLTDNVVAALKGLSGQAAPDKARTSDLRQALKTLVENDFRRLPVVDDEGRVVGILTRSDFLRLFLEGGGR